MRRCKTALPRRQLAAIFYRSCPSLFLSFQICFYNARKHSEYGYSNRLYWVYVTFCHVVLSAVLCLEGYVFASTGVESIRLSVPIEELYPHTGIYCITCFPEGRLVPSNPYQLPSIHAIGPKKRLLPVLSVPSLLRRNIYIMLLFRSNIILKNTSLFSPTFYGKASGKSG